LARENTRRAKKNYASNKNWEAVTSNGVGSGMEIIYNELWLIPNGGGAAHLLFRKCRAGRSETEKKKKKKQKKKTEKKKYLGVFS
jgi:hypothetical protein